MKILILASWYPDSVNPVNGIFIKEQVKALKQVGLIPVVFYPYDKNINRGKCMRFVEDEIIVYRANTDYFKKAKISRLFSMIKAAKMLNKIVVENNISLIHCHVCYTAGFIGYIYSKFFNNIPYIITEHSSKVHEFSNKIYNRILFYLSYKRARYVITVSTYLAKELASLKFKFKSKIIGNVVDTSLYFCNNKQTGNNDKKNWRLLFIGLMPDSEVKGLQYFIPALADFITENPYYNIDFNIVGDGSKRHKYEKMCKDLHISDKCNFYGKVDKSEIPKLIDRNDFLILPSIKETFGSVLIESMAGGKPVLATECGGPEDFVNEKVGILVKPGSKKQLEIGIKSMIENYDYFDPNYIRNYAESKFNYDSIGEELKELYISILSS
ncbi:glycosyltransferase [Clostridium sp. MT-14]|uniref:Glycosyltransferase n=1 Tax=Clostridium aromativorans TaxID=2836848 RepID=A0ABS8N7X0_9CLOT|nr:MULTISPECIES: glycosyltransferase [Clostridium]KAA8675775.1 glycosyltransferase family 4 protein [Clostridium sp. HV4-5-A1G]MCC9295894.1 glycosyltransferase [Clostridium aromativorans]CAB1251650.1 Glycosyl transferase [Clostridiaceae bacterium BL-3]